MVVKTWNKWRCHLRNWILKRRKIYSKCLFIQEIVWHQNRLKKAQNTRFWKIVHYWIFLSFIKFHFYAKSSTLVKHWNSVWDKSCRKLKACRKKLRIFSKIQSKNFAFFNKLHLLKFNAKIWKKPPPPPPIVTFSTTILKALKEKKITQTWKKSY